MLCRAQAHEHGLGLRLLLDAAAFVAQLVLSGLPRAAIGRCLRAHGFGIGGAQVARYCAGQAPAPGAYAAKTRYRQADAACHLRHLPGGAFELGFDQPQWAVTPGQSAVLYDGEVCLGGGVIAAVDPSA